MRHQLARALPYAPRQLFDLVADVERYPVFLPWVSAARLWGRQETGPGVVDFDAEVAVRFAIVRERFATRVRLDAPALAIDANLISGPFRRLENRWRFAPAGDGGTRLTFEIDFELGSRLLQRLLSANLDTAAVTLVRCFERRAESLYGRPTPAPRTPPAPLPSSA